MRKLVSTSRALAKSEVYVPSSERELVEMVRRAKNPALDTDARQREQRRLADWVNRELSPARVEPHRYREFKRA